MTPIPLATFAKKRRVWADQGMRVGDRTTFDTRTEGLPDVSGWAGPEGGIRGQKEFFAGLLCRDFKLKSELNVYIVYVSELGIHEYIYPVTS
jgi:hypothetical protein